MNLKNVGFRLDGILRVLEGLKQFTWKSGTNLC